MHPPVPYILPSYDRPNYIKIVSNFGTLEITYRVKVSGIHLFPILDVIVIVRQSYHYRGIPINIFWTTLSMSIFWLPLLKLLQKWFWLHFRKTIT